MECDSAMEHVKLLREEGFSGGQIERLLPKLEAVVSLSKQDRRELRERLEAVCPETEQPVAEVKVTLPAEKESNFSRLYNGFGGAVTELLRQNNQNLLEEMDERISNRILKEMNYLFRERENLEEERYRQLDRTIRECQAARQRKSIEEERRKLFRFI